MKVLFKSFYLYFWGILSELQKKRLNGAVKRAIMKNGEISSLRLAHISNRSYAVFMRFDRLERALSRELRAIGR